MQKEYHYPLTRVCLRGGTMTLPRAMLELFPDDGDVTFVGAGGDEHVAYMSHPRVVAGLGELYEQQHLKVNDELVVSKVGDRRFRFDAVTYPDPSDSAGAPVASPQGEGEGTSENGAASGGGWDDASEGVPNGMTGTTITHAGAVGPARVSDGEVAADGAGTGGGTDGGTGGGGTGGAGTGGQASTRPRNLDPRAHVSEKGSALLGAEAHDAEGIDVARLGVERRGVEPESIDRQGADRQGTERLGADRQAAEPRSVEPRVGVAPPLFPAPTGNRYDDHVAGRAVAEPAAEPAADPAAEPATQAAPASADEAAGESAGDVAGGLAQEAAADTEAPAGRDEVVAANVTEQEPAAPLPSAAGRRERRRPPRPAYLKDEADDDASLAAVASTDRLRKYLLPLGFRLEPLGRGVLYVHAELGRRQYKALVHLLPADERLDWAGLLTERRNSPANYLTVVGNAADLVRLMSPAELARATLFSWEGLEGLQGLHESAALTPLDLEPNFARDGLLRPGLERLEAALTGRDESRQLVSAVITWLGTLRAPNVFYLEEVAHEIPRSRETLLGVLDHLTFPPLDLLTKVGNGEFLLRQPVSHALESIVRFVGGVSAELPGVRRELLTGSSHDGPAAETTGPQNDATVDGGRSSDADTENPPGPDQDQAGSSD